MQKRYNRLANKYVSQIDDTDGVYNLDKIKALRKQYRKKPTKKLKDRIENLVKGRERARKKRDYYQEKFFRLARKVNFPEVAFGDYIRGRGMEPGGMRPLRELELRVQFLKDQGYEGPAIMKWGKLSDKKVDPLLELVRMRRSMENYQHVEVLSDISVLYYMP